MSLDTSLLENVRVVNGKTVARCPACAEEGGDNSGDHLFLSPDGKFGCAKYPGSEGAVHRQRIFDLVGVADKSGYGGRKKKVHPTMDKCSEALAWGLEQKSKKKWKETRRDVYRDKAGEPVAAVLRFDRIDGAVDKHGKPLKQYRPIHREQGGWRSGDPSGKWPPFRLNELSEGPVYVCEGEKAASAGAAKGLNCTASAHGAGSAHKTDWKSLAGRNVVILPDNDAAGQKYARTIAKIVSKLNPPGRSKILNLPGLPPTGDLAEFIDQNATVDIVEKLNELAEEVKPESNSEDTAGDGSVFSEAERQAEEIHGPAFFTNDKGVVTSLSEPYWANLYARENQILFEPDEGDFYRYDDATGLFMPHTSARIKTEIATRIHAASEAWGEPGLVKLKRDRALNAIAAHLCGQVEERSAFEKKGRRYIHLANGVISFDGASSGLTKFSPTYRSRNQTPISFDATATCNRFLEELILPAIHEEDVALLQRFAGLFLLGDNFIQRFLILDGTPGGGKGTLCFILQCLVGKVNCTQLRTEHLGQRFEIFRFIKKSLLYGADVPGDFLNKPSASHLKSLVGGDFLDAECKGHKGSFPVEGRFNVLMTSNSRLRVKLDGDIGAWRRRLAIIRYENSPPDKPIPDFGQLLIDTEDSGILNWALVGLRELFRDVEETGDIRLTPRQVGIIDSLLAESDSLRIYLQDQIEGAQGYSLTVKNIVEAYAAYCPTKGWNSLPITVVQRQLEGLMLELFHVSKSGSCGDSGSERGYRGVKFVNDQGLL